MKKLILLFTFCLIASTSFAKVVSFYDENGRNILSIDDINRTVHYTSLQMSFKVYNSSSYGTRLTVYGENSYYNSRYCFEIDEYTISVYRYNTLYKKWEKQRTHNIAEIDEK